MSLEKKKAAAIAAVMLYLQAEQTFGEPVDPPAAEKRFPVAVPDRSMLPGVRPWGMSGRNAQMQMRVMMQLKAFHG